MLIEHQDGYRLVAQAGNHQIVSDQPREQGGQDAGPTPSQILAASLAFCVGVYAVAYAQKNNIPYEGLKVEVDWTTAKDPYRMASFKMLLVMPAPVPEEHRSLLLQFVNQCLIKNTLLNAPQIETELVD